MTARTNLVKSSLFTLGLSAALSAPVVGNAQSVILTGSGSSALLGNSNSVSPGAATWVKEPINHSAPLIHSSIKPSDLVSSYVGRAKGLILARSDSGQGVRYAFNGERASSLNSEAEASFLLAPGTVAGTQTYTVKPISSTVTNTNSLTNSVTNTLTNTNTITQTATIVSGTTSITQTATSTQSISQTISQTFSQTFTQTQTGVYPGTTVTVTQPQAPQNPDAIAASGNGVAEAGAEGVPATFARYATGIDLNPGFSDVATDLHFAYTGLGVTAGSR
jgi:hypothetical protein